MHRKANFRKGLLFALMTVGITLQIPVKAAEMPVKASSTAESPTDGSIWIGSEANGLYRLGRNGRQIKYTAAEGKIPSDSIKTLFFDAQNTLWILDAAGTFTLYTTTGGFRQAEQITDKTECALYDKKTETIYYSSEKKLKSYKKVNNQTKELANLPSEAKSLLIDENEGDFIWVFCKHGVLKVGLDGSVLRWEEAPELLDMLPFTFETNQAPEAVEGEKSSSIWPYIIGILLALLTGVAVGWVLKKRTHTPAQPNIEKHPVTQIPETTVKSVQPAIEKVPVTTTVPETPEEPVKAKEVVKTPEPQKEEKNSKTEPIQAEQPVKTTTTPKGPFTKKVYALIREHLSEPDFDVETIASLTGISRIHVNRKLRQENAPAPSAMIKEARMQHAARLIRQGKLGMSQISMLCGFRTPSYFATAFKEYYGVSPSEFTEEK